MTTTHRWLTTSDAAQYLAIRPATLRAWVKAGKVPAHRMVGTRQLRYHTHELDQAMGLVTRWDWRAEAAAMGGDDDENVA